MDMGILIILLTPILYPVATQIGYNPYHFGLILVLTLGLGLLTPPVGTSLWAGCAIGKIQIENVLKAFAILSYIHCRIGFDHPLPADLSVPAKSIRQCSLRRFHFEELKER